MTHYKATIALALVAGIALSASAHATVITAESGAFSPVLTVDGASATTSLAISAAPGERVSDVNVTIDFTKCDDPISNSGACQGAGGSFNEEIVFRLTSATGVMVDLVTGGTYSGSTPGQRVTVTFDDSASSPVGGTPVDGNFQPVGSLADFIGENPNAVWELFYQDLVGADPLSVNAWSLEITTSSASIPEPGILALLGIGLTGIGLRRRARR